MRRLQLGTAAVILAAASAAAQTTLPGLEPEQEGTPPTAIPDIPADTDPMNREPDPAAGTPAAEKPARQNGSAARDPVCRVVPGDTATGLTVVCDEPEAPGGG